MKYDKLNLLLLLCFFIGSQYVYGQIKFDNILTFSNYKRLYSTDKFIYLTSDIKKEYKKNELTLLDHTGKEVNRIILEGKVQPKINYAGTAGDKTIFSLDNDQYLVVNDQGQRVEEKSFVGEDNVKNEQLLFSDDGLILIQRIKVKKVGMGIRVRKLDLAYNQIWEYEKFPEKGRIDFDECRLQKDGSIAILFLKGGMSNEKGICLISPTGEEKAFEYLKLREETMDFYHFRESRDGNLVLFGDYGSNNTAKSGPESIAQGDPLGLCIVKVDGSNGQMISEDFIDFAALQVQAGDKREDGSPIYDQKAPLIHFMDVVHLNGKSYYLGESALMGSRSESSTSSAGTSTTTSFKQLILQDYYLFDVTDPTGDPIRIWKPERTVELKIGGATTDRVRKVMMNNRLFSYQGMSDGKIVSRGFSHMHHYYTLIDPAIGMEKINERVYWPKPHGSNASTFPPRSTYYSSSTSSFGKVYLSDKGILPVGDGFVLYNYSDRTNLLKLASLKN